MDTITESVAPDSVYYKTQIIKPSDMESFTMDALMTDTLIPMEIYHQESGNPYEKYGFAFSANCYGCNGINIHITDSVIFLSGSCGDDLLSQTFRIEEKETTGKNEIVIAVEDARFIFSKVDTVAVYRLTIDGNLELEGENMTRHYFTQPIDFYYTPRKELYKFVIYDCGDFDG